MDVVTAAGQLFTFLECVGNVFAVRNEKSQALRPSLCKQCSAINKLHTTQGLSGMSSSVTVPMEISGIPAFLNRLPKIMPYDILFHTDLGMSSMK